MIECVLCLSLDLFDSQPRQPRVNYKCMIWNINISCDDATGKEIKLYKLIQNKKPIFVYIRFI